MGGLALAYLVTAFGYSRAPRTAAPRPLPADAA